MTPCEITLAELLDSRDRRAAMQRQLLTIHPTGTLVVLTIVAPGPCKKTRQTAIVAQAALNALDSIFTGKVVKSLIRDLKTGFEAYYVVTLTAEESKNAAVAIEDSHPLGRLMDIDVITPAGIPISRSTPRPCLLCGKPARECMRAATHTQQDILSYIEELCNEYVQRL